MNRRDFEAMYGDDIPPDPDDMYLRTGTPLARLATSCIGLLVVVGVLWLAGALVVAWVRP